MHTGIPVTTSRPPIPKDVLRSLLLVRVVRNTAAERRVTLFVATSLLIAVVAAALFWPPWYRAEVTFIPPEATKQKAVMAAVGAQMANVLGALMGGAAGEQAIYTGVLKSRTMLDRVIASCDLQRAYGEQDLEKVRRRLAENTTVWQDKKSGFLSVRVDDRDAARSAAVANAYLNELAAILNEISATASFQERQFLEERARQAELDLKQASGRLAEFSRKKGVVDVPEQARSLIGSIAELEGQKLATEAELQAARSLFTDTDARTRTLIARRDQLSRSIEQMNGTISAHDEISLRTIPGVAIEYVDLYRAVRINETVLLLLTRQIEMLRIQEARPMSEIRIVDAALVPDRPAGPARGRLIIFGTLMACLISIAVAHIKAEWGALEEDDPRKLLAGEIRGFIPRSTFKRMEQ